MNFIINITSIVTPEFLLIQMGLKHGRSYLNHRMGIQILTGLNAS